MCDEVMTSSTSSKEPSIRLISSPPCITVPNVPGPDAAGAGIARALSLVTAAGFAAFAALLAGSLAAVLLCVSMLNPDVLIRQEGGAGRGSYMDDVGAAPSFKSKI